MKYSAGASKFAVLPARERKLKNGRRNERRGLLQIDKGK